MCKYRYLFQYNNFIMLLVMKMDKALMGKDIPVAVLRNNYINGVDKYNYENLW